MVTLNKQSQSSFVLFLWFAFINTQLLLFIFTMFYWRLNHMRVPLRDITLWDSTLWAEPLMMIIFIWAAIAGVLGLWMGNRFYAEVEMVRKTAVDGIVTPVKLILSFVLLDTVAVIGLAVGIIRGNSCLAIPFISVATVFMIRLFPSARRFANPRN